MNKITLNILCVYVFVWIYGFSFFWIYVFIANSYGNYMFNYKKLQNHSPLYYFTVLPAEHESFCCFTCLPVLGIVPTLFQRGGCKMQLVGSHFPIRHSTWAKVVKARNPNH